MPAFRLLQARHAALAALGAFFTLACAAGIAHAQGTAGAAAQTAHQTPQAAAPARTRAEAVAELQCARESGELEAAMLRSHGLPYDQRHAAQAPCAQSGSARLAGGSRQPPATR